MKRRILSIITALALCLSMLPPVVFATEAGDTGDFTVTGGTPGTDYTFDSEGTNGEYGVLNIKTDAALTIKNTDPNIPTINRIAVSGTDGANITLAGVNIDVSSRENATAFQI